MLPNGKSNNRYNTRYFYSSNLVILHRKRPPQKSVENEKENSRLIDIEYKKKKKARTYDPLCSGDAILSKMKNNDPLDRKISSNLITLFDL